MKSTQRVVLVVVRVGGRGFASSSSKGTGASVPRSPIAWKSPEFYDKTSFEKEFRRVLDVCHGCRRVRPSCFPPTPF